MELRHVDYRNLTISPLNMRYGTTPDVSDILPTIRAKGILQPLLIRQNGSPETFEVVAGARRYTAASIIVAEAGEIEPLPCAVLAEDDDVAALEASLIENFARLDPDEITQHQTFARLVGEGRTVDEIAETFGITPRMVERRLALGNLIPQIRDLYRAEKINADTVRHLTLATEKQQKAWLKLFNSPKDYVPVGHNLKQWLFGGAAIPTSNALFPLDSYKGRIVEYCEAARRVFGPLLRSYNRSHGTRHRLRVERPGADMPRLPARMKQYFDRFVGAANKSSLHPFDWRRFYDFVSVSRKALREEEMRALLTDAGFDRHHADTIAQTYCHLMDYKQHRVRPWLAPSG